ncbi:MAG TPA: ZIP family metal transporter [Candidatus Saccharimonadales bacterium]|nr:ZIP family metal transporter [Candidatus Saccharimonadales bacterium]
MIVFILTLLASGAALAGGMLAIRSRKKINLALDFTAGIVLGLVAFDLLPEIFKMADTAGLDTVWPMIALVSGFLLFHLFEKLVPLHESGEEPYGPHRHPWLGTARAMALTGHSFLDGLSIGIAFQAGSTVGTAVAIAVIGHRFADGFDTTTFMLVNKNKLTHIKKWLSAVILMPVIGGLASLVLTLSESTLAIYLGFFAGFILYIGASNIMPQAHSKNSSRATFLLTVLGVLFILAVTRLAGF